MALRPLSESERQRRTIDERLFVRLPALFRLLSERVIRLSPGSRIRRIMLTRLIRRAYGAMYRRDFDVLLPRLDPALEYRPRGGLFSVDVDTVIHGREGYRNLWETTLEAFDDLWIEAHEVVDFGDRFVITFHAPGPRICERRARKPARV